MEKLQAIAIGWVTELGIPCSENPIVRGNSITLVTEKVPYDDTKRSCAPHMKGMPASCYFAYDDTIKHYYPDNMSYENLTQLLRTKVVDWPVEIEVMHEHHVTVTDPRIPIEWRLPSI